MAFSISVCAVRATMFEGIEKPMPMLPLEPPAPPWEPDSIWLLTPTTWPSVLSSGPPLLPLLIAASVWMTPVMGWLSGETMVRFRALTIPVVTVLRSPYGSPMATTASPTVTAEESAKVSGWSSLAGALMRITATSLLGSLPMTLPP